MASETRIRNELGRGRPRFDDSVRVFSALGDSNRLRIVLALRQGDLCVCQIVSLLELANSTVSRHLQILRETGVIESYKQGRWVYYRIASDPEGRMLVRALLPMLSLAEASARVAEDERRLKRIRRIDPEQLCHTQLDDVN